MSETTTIGWCHATKNKVIGCTKVSEGCRLCYAETMDRQRYSKTLDGASKESPISHWGPGAPRHVCADFDRDLRRWNAKPPAEWGLKPGERGRVFVNSMSDWLDEEWPIEVLAEFLQTVHACPNLDLLASTKRPENFILRLQLANGWLAANGDLDHFESCPRMQTAFWIAEWLKGNAPRNFWFLTTVENQKAADERLPHVLKVPAVIRGLSLEPLVGSIDFGLWFSKFGRLDDDFKEAEAPIQKIHWIIVGGESGRGFKEMDIAEFHSVCDQATASEIPLFVKQDSGLKSSQQGRIINAWWRFKQFPKQATPEVVA